MDLNLNSIGLNEAQFDKANLPDLRSILKANQPVGMPANASNGHSNQPNGASIAGGVPAGAPGGFAAWGGGNPGNPTVSPDPANAANPANGSNPANAAGAVTPSENFTPYMENGMLHGVSGTFVNEHTYVYDNEAAAKIAEQINKKNNSGVKFSDFDHIYYTRNPYNQPFYTGRLVLSAFNGSETVSQLKNDIQNEKSLKQTGYYDRFVDPDQLPTTNVKNPIGRYMPYAVGEPKTANYNNQPYTFTFYSSSDEPNNIRVSYRGVDLDYHMDVVRNGTNWREGFPAPPPKHSESPMFENVSNILHTMWMAELGYEPAMHQNYKQHGQYWVKDGDPFYISVEWQMQHWKKDTGDEIRHFYNQASAFKDSGQKDASGNTLYTLVNDEYHPSKFQKPTDHGIRPSQLIETDPVNFLTIPGIARPFEGGVHYADYYENNGEKVSVANPYYSADSVFAIRSAPYGSDDYGMYGNPIPPYMPYEDWAKKNGASVDSPSQTDLERYNADAAEYQKRFKWWDTQGPPLLGNVDPEDPWRPNRYRTPSENNHFIPLNSLMVPAIMNDDLFQTIAFSASGFPSSSVFFASIFEPLDPNWSKRKNEG